MPATSPHADETPAPSEPSLAALGLAGVGAARALAADLLGLLALEARLAGLSLGGIVFAAVGGAFTAMAFWLLLQIALVLGLARLGVDPLWPVAACALLNGLAVLWLLRLIRRLGRNLLFRATAEALRSGAAHASAAPRDPH